MKISVAYAAGFQGKWIELDVESPISIAQVIEQSHILTDFPELNLTQYKVGKFGKIYPSNTLVNEGERVEIYHPLIRKNDPDDDDDD